MATIKDVIIFENALDQSKRLIYDPERAFAEFNNHIEAIESTMEKEFDCSRSKFKSLPQDKELGPIAEKALQNALSSK